MGKVVRVAKSGANLEKVGKSWEKWLNVVNSGEKLEKVKKSGKKSYVVKSRASPYLTSPHLNSPHLAKSGEKVMESGESRKMGKRQEKW